MLALLLLAAPLLAADRPAPVPVAESQAAAAGAREPAWTKRYPIREFGLFWHIELEVKDGAKARKKLLAAAKKHKAEPTQPLETATTSAGYDYQQFSYRLDREPAGELLEQLVKLGKAKRLSQKENPASGMNLDEAGAKLQALTEERERGRTALQQLPSVTALLDEVLGHLQLAYFSFKDSGDRVLFNIVIEQEKKGEKKR